MAKVFDFSTIAFESKTLVVGRGPVTLFARLKIYQCNQTNKKFEWIDYGLFDKKTVMMLYKLYFKSGYVGLELLKSVKPSLKTKATAFEIPSDIYKIWHTTQ